SEHSSGVSATSSSLCSDWPHYTLDTLSANRKNPLTPKRRYAGSSFTPYLLASFENSRSDSLMCVPACRFAHFVQRSSGEDDVSARYRKFRLRFDMFSLAGPIVVEGDKCYVTAQCPNGKEVKCNGDIYTCTIHMVGSGVVGVKCNDKFESCSGSTFGTGFGSMNDKSHMPINGNKL
ncbi:MAG: hypothetical protein K2K33_05360, partial [Muribaculaceae bacterium]|nr:hypothetical protein [Muribaculaceae bacterium]